MKRTITVLVTAAALMLTSCSATAPVGNDAPSAQPAPATTAIVEVPATSKTDAAPGEAASYQLVTMGNATVSFFLPANVTDPRLSEIEAFRRDTKAPAVSYIIAEVDNRDGLEPVNMYNISAFDADGKKYEFSRVDEAINDWKPSYTSDYEYVMPDGSKLDAAAGDALNNRGVALNNAHINNAAVGERTTLVLCSTATDFPQKFAKVTAQPNGMGDPQEAVLAAVGGKD